jgi:hypothetical protein
MSYTANIRNLNSLISAQCVEGGLLEGVTFENTIFKPLHNFPFVVTKFSKLNTINTNGGNHVVESVDILIACGDVLDNHNGDELDLYDSVIDKLSIAKGLVRSQISDDEIEIETTRFEGSKKGAVAAVIVTMYC